MARGGAALGETDVVGLSRRHRRTSDLRAIVPRYARARQSVVVEVCAKSSRNGSPVLAASTAR